MVEDAFEGLTKAKEVEATFVSLGIDEDLTRVKDSRNIRAGKGKRRGRKMKQAVGPLIVVVEGKSLANAASNLPGVEVTTVANLNTEMLAPGTHPGRLTVWTNGAIEKLTSSIRRKNLMDINNIITFPLMTESASVMVEKDNKLIFIVNLKAGKADVKRAVETLYEVKVSKVNLLVTPQGEKKAFVKLKPEFRASDVAIKLGIL